MAKEEPYYESGTTKLSLVLSAAPCIVALWLLWNGVYYFGKFPGAHNLGWLFIFSIAPMLFGIGLIAVTVIVVQRNMGRRVIISRTGFGYEHGNVTFTLK